MDRKDDDVTEMMQGQNGMHTGGQYALRNDSQSLVDELRVAAKLENCGLPQRLRVAAKLENCGLPQS